MATLGGARSSNLLCSIRLRRLSFEPLVMEVD
jgi:hypothetical protein